jgi:hypothetical protein
MPTRNPPAVRQRAVTAAHQRTGQPVAPPLDPVGCRLQPAGAPGAAAAAAAHDVGYARALNRLGFHAVDGARFLRAYGQERLACLVAHHSGACFEAEERGLVEVLAAFPVEDGPVMDALTFADMTTGPAGQPMTLEQRISDVQRRYRADDPVHRAIVRARPLLQAAIDRTRQRLAGRLRPTGGGPAG